MGKRTQCIWLLFFPSKRQAVVVCTCNPSTPVLRTPTRSRVLLPAHIPFQLVRSLGNNLHFSRGSVTNYNVFPQGPDRVMLSFSSFLGGLVSLRIGVYIYLSIYHDFSSFLHIHITWKLDKTTTVRWEILSTEPDHESFLDSRWFYHTALVEIHCLGINTV